MNEPEFNPIPAPDLELPLRKQYTKEESDIAFGLIADLILRSNFPDDGKIEIRLMQAFDNLLDSLTNGLTPYFHPQKPGEFRQQLLPLRQEVLEYITLMEAGLKTFLDAHPMPAEDQ